MLRVTHDLVPSLLLLDNTSGHSATVQCPPAAAMIRIILLMMAAPKTMAQNKEEIVTCSGMGVSLTFEGKQITFLQLLLLVVPALSRMKITKVKGNLITSITCCHAEL